MRYFFLCLFLAATMLVKSQEGRKIAALLVANNTYTGPSFVSLAQPVNDLIRMRELLIDVKVSTGNIREKQSSMSATEMLNEIKLNRDIFREKGITDVIFYYAGHGLAMPQTGESFLIPGNFREDSLHHLYSATYGINENVLKFIKDATNATSPNYLKEFTSNLRTLNLLNSAVPLSTVCRELGEFNLLVISDACRDTLPDISRGILYNSQFSEKDLKAWMKENTKLKKDSEQASFIDELKKFNDYVKTQLANFNRTYTEFRNSISDITLHKPITILYGATYYNKAQEDPNNFAGVFTKALDETIRSTKQLEIRFDDDFLDKIRNNISPVRKQSPYLEGYKSFKLANPFIRAQSITIANVNKLIKNNSFEAISLKLQSSTTSPVNYFSKTKLVRKLYEREEVLKWPGFRQLLAKDSMVNCNVLTVHTLTRISSMWLNFEDAQLRLFHDQEVTVLPVFKHEFSSDNCDISLKDPSDLSNDMKNQLPLQHFDAGGGYRINTDSTITFLQKLSIPSFGTFSEFVVRRISPEFDSMYLEFPDINSNTTLAAVFVKRKMDTKTFSAASLPYTGDYYGTKYKKITGFTRSENYYPTNVALPTKLKSGKYRATIKMAIQLDSSYYSLPDSIKTLLKNDFLRLEVNNITDCRNPASPLSNGDICYKNITKNKYGIEPVLEKKNQDYSYSIDFELIAPVAETPVISIPFSFAYRGIVNSINMEFLRIECMEEYDASYVSNYFDSLKRSNERLQQIKLEEEKQKRFIATQSQRLAELSSYTLQQYSNLSFIQLERFTYDTTWKWDFPYGRQYHRLNSASVRNDRLEMYQGGSWNRYWHNNLPNNYQVEAELSFSAADGKQYFMWGGDFNCVQGYYIQPVREGNSYYLALGYRDGAQRRELGRVNIGYSNYSLANGFTNGSSFAKVTVRKYQNNFYIFFDEKFIDKIPYKEYITGNWFIIRNDVAVSTPMTTGENWLRVTDYILTIKYIRYHEIIDKME